MTKFISDKRFPYGDDLIVIAVTADPNETWVTASHKGGVIIRETIGGVDTQEQANAIANQYAAQAIDYLEAEKLAFNANDNAAKLAFGQVK